MLLLVFDFARLAFSYRTNVYRRRQSRNLVHLCAFPAWIATRFVDNGSSSFVNTIATAGLFKLSHLPCTYLHLYMPTRLHIFANTTSECKLGTKIYPMTI